MESNLGLYSYSITAILFALLSILALTLWRGRLNGILFFLFCSVTACWAGFAAYSIGLERPVNFIVILLELVRNAIWFLFLIRLLLLINPDRQQSQTFKNLTHVAYITPVLMIGLLFYMQLSGEIIPWLGFDMRILTNVMMSIIGLSFVEQLFRGARLEQRWSYKFLCFGIACLYAFDFYLYSDALLFKQMDIELWYARGIVYAIAVPLIAIAVARNPTNDSNIQVSRTAVFYTTAIIITGIYLLVMSAGGFYLKQFGGDWGKIAAIAFLFAGILFLLILFFSGHVRARLRVFIDKHFLDYKYDYREQWLGLIRELSNEDEAKKLEERALHAITEIVDSPGGSLWVRKNQQYYVSIAQAGMTEIDDIQEEIDGSLIKYLENWQWVVNIQEYHAEPGLYQGLVLPEWLEKVHNSWLVVPLMLQAKLYGFIVVLRPRAEKEFNWEDIDLLKTAGRQVAIHLAQQRSSLALVQARQFEAFNRFSAYVVHDLKNLVSQLALVVKNAEKHKHNPAFMDDAIKTVDNSVDRMNRLLAQLRAGTTEKQTPGICNLSKVLQAACKDKIHGLPIPKLNIETEKLLINGDAMRLTSVLGHIVQNAQDATSDNGEILVTLVPDENIAVINVQDTGCGMDQAFINERLFKPFDTTKGLTGMGIGAHESKSFIEELGGSLSVSSELGKGSIFTIRLPLIRANS